MNTLYKKNANIRFFLSPLTIKLFIFLLLAILYLPLNLVSGEDAMIPGFRGIIPERSLQEENGVFQIAFYEKGAWRNMGALSFGRYYMRKTLALPQILIGA